MKLHLSLLRKFVEIPLTDQVEIEDLLNDLGIEVKSTTFVNNDDEKDFLFSLELLANRGDHHGVLGISREIASRYCSQITFPPLASAELGRGLSIPVRINTDRCYRYYGMELVVPSELTLRPEIESVLLTSPKHPIVDTLNYIQYELGQPLHAFDRDKLYGEIRVDLTKQNEEFIALDGNKYQIPVGSLVIKDARKIIAVAGVIGSADSSVDDSTKRIVVESACFDPQSIRITARAMGISTDASKIFERGSDPEMVEIALRRLAYLLANSGAAGGCQVLGVMQWKNDLKKVELERTINLDLNAIRLAVNAPKLPELEVEMRFKPLGFKLEKHNKAFSVSVPTWRIWDVENEADLVEEFARSYGINNIKLKTPIVKLERPKKEPIRSLRNQVCSVITGMGFNEVITRSFCSEAEVKLLRDFGFDVQHVRLMNSLESSYSHLRGSLLPSLLRLIAENHSYGITDIKVYEFSRVFSLLNEQEIGNYKLALAWTGKWNSFDKHQLDLQDSLLHFKGVVSSVLVSLGIEANFDLTDFGFYHPSAQGRFSKARKTIGTLGIVHPSLVKNLIVKGLVHYAEIDVELLLSLSSSMGYKEPSRIQSSKRDITVKVPIKTSAGKVLEQLKKQVSDKVELIEIYDWFVKEAEEFRRITYRLTLRGEKNSLSAAEVEDEILKLREFVEQDLKLSLA